MEERKITGMMIYYYFVCKRKLWYFSKGLSQEADDENVKIGKFIDENSYKRDEKHISIDETINIDFLRHKNVLHEVKKSKSIEEASIWQVKYYLYYLKQKGSEIKAAQLDYPLLKQTVEINLEQEDIDNLEKIQEDIKDILKNSLPPAISKKGFCKKCAYFEFCFI